MNKSMQKIDVEAIIKEAGLVPREAAKELFPANKYSMAALKRVFDGESFLDSNQLIKLSLLTGCSVSDLYTTEGWKVNSKKGKHTFTKGDYVAELRPETNITRIYRKGSMLHKSILHEGSITLSGYINILNNQISNYE